MINGLHDRCKSSADYVGYNLIAGFQQDYTAIVVRIVKVAFFRQDV